MSANFLFFQKYFNNIFIETGSGNGDGIWSAINCGFKEIFSIELSQKLYRYCTNKYQEYKNVHIIYGDSREELSKIIVNINEPITFWLDAHISGGDTVGEDLPPLFEEIEIIGKHHIKSHTILIDDLRCWNWNNELMSAILKINSCYQFTIEDGLFPQDILTARVI